MRLIDVDALEKRLDNEKWMDNYDRDFIVDVALDEAPTVDAAPVVHGRWILSGDDDEFMNCSVCGIQRYSEDKDFKCDITSYCPHCGARMAGKCDENENY